MSLYGRDLEYHSIMNESDLHGQAVSVFDGVIFLFHRHFLMDKQFAQRKWSSNWTISTDLVPLNTNTKLIQSKFLEMIAVITSLFMEVLILAVLNICTGRVVSRSPSIFSHKALLIKSEEKIQYFFNNCSEFI